MSTSPNDELLKHLGELRSRRYADQPNDDESVKLVKFSAVVVAVIVVVGLLWASAGAGKKSNSTSATPVSYSKPDNADAITFAQTFVKRLLKAPSTASFPWSFNEYDVSDLGGGRWRVSGYVDAQNGFGAMLRSRWTVEMQVEGSTWKLVDASID